MKTAGMLYVQKLFYFLVLFYLSLSFVLVHVTWSLRVYLFVLIDP